MIFQLIQYGTNCKEIAPPSDPVWDKNCKEYKKGYLEHLLYLLKTNRNFETHEHKIVKGYSLDDLKIFFGETVSLLNRILEETHKRKHIDVDEVKKKVENDADKIRLSFDIRPIIASLKKKFWNKYFNELKKYFTSELKCFTAPNFAAQNLFHKSDNFICGLKDFFQVTKNYQVTIICGEADSGKTSLLK